LNPNKLHFTYQQDVNIITTAYMKDLFVEVKNNLSEKALAKKGIRSRMPIS
jgi:hypothetical protein